jgi:small subunit ribosomal protein S17
MNNTTTTSKTGGGREFRGTVVSSKMKDTVVVAIERYVKHPKYKKFQRRTKKFLAHDEGNTSTEGAVVTIKETRPISRRKTFIVVK